MTAKNKCKCISFAFVRPEPLLIIYFLFRILIFFNDSSARRKQSELALGVLTVKGGFGLSTERLQVNIKLSTDGINLISTLTLNLSSAEKF